MRDLFSIKWCGRGIVTIEMTSPFSEDTTYGFERRLEKEDWTVPLEGHLGY